MDGGCGLLPDGTSDTTLNGPFVYRKGRQVFILERGVQLS